MTAAARNVALYPWFKFFQSLLFWQATWFLYFQSELSAAEAVMLYAIYDLVTTVLEVPSGWLSDQWGRKKTLILSTVFGLASAVMFWIGGGFWLFVLAQAAMGAHIAFVSGTDSSFLYESLEETGRADEVEAQELRAWRFGFVALALSAVTGGAIALVDLSLPFLASAAAFVIVLLVVFRFNEPAIAARDDEMTSSERRAAIWAALRQPVLLWIFALSVLMYGYSHLPFVFGQPFILAALSGLGLAAEAPLVSGAVTASMMLLSLATSLAAPGIRKKIGFAGILLLAFAMQILIVGGLAATGSILAIALLLLRMVPDSFSQPFIRARIQPELRSEVRATFLSLKSLAGRIAFSASLFLAASGASSVGEMSQPEVRAILAVYAGVGLVAFLVLLVTARGRGI